MANYSLVNELEENGNRFEKTNHQDDVKPSFSVVHHHNRFTSDSQLHSTEQYSTSPSSINGNLDEHQFTSSKSDGYLPSPNNKLLIIDCGSSSDGESSTKTTSFNYQTDSTIYHPSMQPTTFQFELWRIENDEQNLLLITKKTIHRPRFVINYSQLFDEWSDQEFVYSIYILAYNNQGKSDHLLTFTFSHPEQLLQEQSKLKHLFKLIPFSLVFNDQKTTRNQSKLFKSSNFTRPFTQLSAGSLYKGMCALSNNKQQKSNLPLFHTLCLNNNYL